MEIFSITGGFDTCTCVLVQVYGLALLNHQPRHYKTMQLTNYHTYNEIKSQTQTWAQA